MKFATKVLMCLAACFCFSNAIAQQLTYVETKVVEIWPRSYGLHFVIDTTAYDALTLTNCSANNKRNPVSLLTDANQKTYKETIMLAYAMNRSLRVYFDPQNACTANGYP